MDLSVRSETWGGDDQSWLGAAHGQDMGRSVTLSTAAFTAATHYPDGYVRSGTPVGRITASGLYGPYDNAAADGRQDLAGFILSPVKMTTGGANVGAAVLEHGRVVESRLPIAIDAAGKTDVAGRITFA